MKASSKEILKEIPKATIRLLFSPIGLGSSIMALLLVFYAHTKFLLSIQTTLGITLLLIALGVLLGYFRAKDIFEPKDLKVLKEPLIQVGPLKWKVTHFSDGSYIIDPLPYCPEHERRFVEDNYTYFCYYRCGQQITQEQLNLAQQMVDNEVEAATRKLT